MKLRKNELHPCCFYKTNDYTLGIGFMKLGWLGWMYNRTELGSIVGYEKSDKSIRFYI